MHVQSKDGRVSHFGDVREEGLDTVEFVVIAPELRVLVVLGTKPPLEGELVELDSPANLGGVTT